MKRLRVKCWIDDDGEKFFGPGPNELLKKIHEQGSLSKAASQMKMSYKKAWDIVQKLNQNPNKPMVLLKKGGAHGGGAEVTEYGLTIIKGYDHLEQQISTLVEKQHELLEVLK